MILPVQAYRPGDWVIYRKQKSSVNPGPRAANVHAATKGNLYRYTVDKFWVVESIDDQGRLLLRTRRGKHHCVDPDDASLRKIRLWERWIYRNRFEMIASASTDSSSQIDPDESSHTSANENSYEVKSENDTTKTDVS